MTDEVSETLHDILEQAAADLRGAGLAGVAPWRAMAWVAFQHIREESCSVHAGADLRRLRKMLDAHLSDLGEALH